MEVGPSAGTDDGPGFDDVELIDLTPLAAMADPSPDSPGWGLVGTMAAGLVGVLVALGIGLWVLAGGGDDEGTAGPDPAAPEPVPTTDGPRPSTTSTSSTTPTDQAVAGGAEGPLLDRPAGWSLLVGGWSRPDLELLDLDTGSRTDIAADVLPLAVVGGWMAVQDEADGETLRVVPVADPAAAGVTVESVGPWQIGVVPTADGTGMWVGSVVQGSLLWTLVDLADAEPVVADEVDAGPVRLLLSPAAAAGPEVSGSASGGVFALERGSYRQVHPASPLAASRDHVLVKTCPGTRDCALSWLRRDTWEPEDRPIPPRLLIALAFSPDGRFLVYLDTSVLSGSDGSAHLFDVERGVVVADVRPDPDNPGLAFSPDGRLLAYAESGQLNVYDAATGAVVDTGIPATDGGTQAVFVPTTDPGTAGSDDTDGG